ncbi:hypothetical protein [Pseudomonas sp. KBW05]|uniref:hypothetical protein n=1 Tax=Pseudomonas sp. KBW05 TaxID=2153360 RepID=UPI000F5B3A4D|nr:hypothetical protein [Pseudomonas sp. KBW05]RQO50482.1 hypothetical protein DBR46_21745 [Pseudomonas sp. KBW05]
MSKRPVVHSHLPVCCQPSTRVNDLDLPIFSNPVLGVVGADRGLGARHIQPYLLVTLSRWTDLGIGDTFEFYAGNSVIPLASDFVRPGEETNSSFRLVIEEERFPLGFTFPVFSRVVRNGPGTPSTSDNLTVFAKVARPGLDEQPGLGYHDKLQLSLPADLAGPDAVLTPERAALGVKLTIDYPGKRVRDKVYLYWDTILQLVIFELDDDHASGVKPIEVEVGPAIIGTGSGLISIRYQVFDEVDNRSGHVEHFSQAVNLLAELDPSLLERAYFQVNFMDTTTVNYDQEAGSNFRVEVVAPRRLPDGSLTPAGARIVVTLSCTRADSSTFTVELPDALVNPGRSSFFNVEEDIIKQLVRGSMKITWRLDFPLGTSLATSQSLTVLISGTIANMPAVNVVEALGGVVDPSEPYITIEYPNPAYSPYDPSNLVTLCMEAFLPGGGIVSYEVSHIAGAPPPPTRFRTVANAFFSRFIGLGPVRIFYKVDDGVIRLLGAGTQTVRESESTFVEFGPRIPEMPRPEIDRVDENDNLDPRDLFGQLDITLPYLRTFPGDRFQWRLIGTAPTGSTNGEIPLSGATAGRPVVFSLDRRYADVNVDGLIRLSYSLIPANGSRTLHSYTLEVTVGEAFNLLMPDVVEASKNPAHLTPEAVTAGATIRVTFPQMRLSDRIRACWKGIPDIGSYCETKDGNAAQVVDYTVPPQVVGANIAPFGQQISVQYFLLRSGRETPSPILDLLLLNLTTLPIPTIEGIGDVPLLEIAKLNGTERTIINVWPFINRYQRIWLEYTGTYASPEAPYFEATYTNNLVTENGEREGISPPTPVDELRKLKEGSILRIKSWVSFDRGSSKANAVLLRERDYTVKALPSILPHPFIGGTMDVDNDVTIAPLPIEHNTTVTVEYVGMSDKDRITLTWVYADGTHYEIPLDGVSGGQLVFNLTAAKVLHRSVNSTVQLQYSVKREGVTDPIPSKVQTVRVSAIPAASLAGPRINGLADGSTLDLSAFTGNALASLAKWALSNTGQRAWITCSSAGVAPLEVLGASGAVITSTEAANGLVNKPALRSWFEALADNAQITVRAAVTFDGSANRANAVEFTPTSYSLKSRRLIEGVDFQNGQRGGWVNRSSSGDLVSSGPNLYWYGIGSGEFQCGLKKTFPYGVLPWGATYELTFDFMSSTNNGCFVLFSNSSGAAAGGGGWTPVTLRFSPPYSSVGAAFVIDILNSPSGGNVGFSLDNIKIWRL